MLKSAIDETCGQSGLMDMNEATVVAAAGPADLIASVWFTLGYRPRDSIVLVGLEGARRRAGMMLRTDFPLPVVPGESFWPAGSEAGRSLVIRDLLATVTRSGAQAVLALIDHDDALRRPRPAAVAVLVAEASRVGLELTDVLGVTETAFASLICTDPRCCPVGGIPIEAVMSSRGALVHVVHGSMIADSEAELIADVRPTGVPIQPGAVPAAAQLNSSRRLSPSGRHWWWRCWTRVRSDSGTWEDAVPLGLAAALYDHSFRDAVLLDLFGAPSGSIDRLFADPRPGYEAGSGCEASFEALLMQPPDPVKFDRVRAALAAAVRVAAVGDRAPALSVLAMMAWFEGHGARARLLVARAREDAPTVTLTGLVDELLTLRVPPPWSRIAAQTDKVDTGGPEFETDLGDCR